MRGLAAELDIAKRGRNADLNRAEFAELCDTVLAACSTPEQRGRAEAARKLYDADLQAAVPVKLPAVPALPPLPADAPSSSSSVGVKIAGPSASGADPASRETCGCTCRDGWPCTISFAWGIVLVYLQLASLLRRGPRDLVGGVP